MPNRKGKEVMARAKAKRTLTGMYVECEEDRRILHLRLRYGRQKRAVYECGVNFPVGCDENTTVLHLRWMANRIEEFIAKKDSGAPPEPPQTFCDKCVAKGA